MEAVVAVAVGGSEAVLSVAVVVAVVVVVAMVAVVVVLGRDGSCWS